MKKLLVITVLLLFGGFTFSQDRFTVPDITPAQKHNYTIFQFWVMHAAGINFAKAQGTSPYDYGKHIGNLFAPSWNKETGFDGFVNGLIYNWETFKSDEDGPMKIKENDDGSVTIEYPIKAWKKFLPEGNSYASFHESMESIRGIIETIADYLGCTIAQEISQESILFTIDEK